MVVLIVLVSAGQFFYQSVLICSHSCYVNFWRRWKLSVMATTVAAVVVDTWFTSISCFFILIFFLIIQLGLDCCWSSLTVAVAAVSTGSGGGLASSASNWVAASTSSSSGWGTTSNNLLPVHRGLVLTAELNAVGPPCIVHLLF